MRRVEMKRAYLILLLSVTIVLTLSFTLAQQADAVVISDHCIVIGSGELPNGDMLSCEVIPVDGVVNGTWEHWQACENPVTSCEEYNGALYGLCNAYCNAMECAGDEPNASEEDCEDVRGNFFKMGGDVLPCEPCFNHFVGNVERMYCWRNGIVLADFWGTGTWNGVPGYDYLVHVQDFGDAGPDFYQTYIWAPDGSLALSAADFLSSGNLVVLP
jgi:hypothetical protein